MWLHKKKSSHAQDFKAHFAHTRTHTYVQLDTPHTCWVFRGSWAPFCLYLKMKGEEEERQAGGRGGGGIRGEEEEQVEEEGDGQRGRGQRKRADKEEEEEQGWRVIANSACSLLSSLLLSLSFVNRWVEVSDCEENQSVVMDGQTDTYILYIQLHTHTFTPLNRCSNLHALLLLIFPYDQIYVWYEYTSVCVCLCV